MKNSLALTIALLACCVFCMADVVIGEPATNGNCFPFGCTGTIYQQVYAAGNFSGPLTITGVGFFHTLSSGGNIIQATYTLSFSTTSKAINGLNTTNFDENLGADNQLFAAAALSGPVVSELDIMGAPFTYNPALGNLLLDVRVSDRTNTGGGIYLDSRSGNANGLFSRAHNFGGGFENYGLVTRFITEAVPPSGVPEPASITLLGTALLLTAGIARRRLGKR